jgi:LPXTG-site transpeptidase (sortase) family protein
MPSKISKDLGKTDSKPETKFILKDGAQDNAEKPKKVKIAEAKEDELINKSKSGKTDKENPKPDEKLEVEAAKTDTKAKPSKEANKKDKLSKKRPFYKHKGVLMGFFLLIILAAGGLLLWQSYEEFRYNQAPPDPNVYAYKISDPNLLFSGSESENSEPKEKPEIKMTNKLPPDHRLVIPKIGVDTAIVEGSNLEVLDRVEGAWREPGSSTPLSSGNMVIAGHRFQYLPPNTTTFYHLNKLASGDKILVYWKEDGEIKDYIYEIYNIQVVEPTAYEVRFPNPEYEKEITLYTCGPEVGERDKRIVVKAKLIS